MKTKLCILSFFVLKMIFSQSPTADDLVTIHTATQAEITAMTGLYEGSLIYNTDDKLLYQYSGSSWQKLTPEGNETKIITNGNVTITGSGTTADPYIVTGIKSTFTDNGNGSFTFSNGIDPDVNFTPTVSGNTPIVANTSAGIGNCASFGLNQTEDITINGAYFDGASTVMITGQTINSVVINSPTQITANITSGGVYGSFDISVTNNAGVGTLTGGFQLLASSPLNTYTYATNEMTITGSINYNGTTLNRTASNGWNAQGYSTTHVISTNSGGHVDFTADQSNRYLMAGLSSNPSASSSYTNLDFAVYMVANSRIQIRENGTSLGYVSTYSAGDQFRINVDCLGNVTYLQNGNIIYSSSKKATAPLYFDSSLYSVNSSLSNISITY